MGNFTTFKGDGDLNFVAVLKKLHRTPNLDIEVVLIDTEAHKALDVFYVGKIGGEVQERLKNALIAACTAS